MLRPKTMVGSGCLLMILITGGFIFLLRSCLSKYDERSAHLPAIVYSNDTTALILSIVSYDKTNSYESRGGFTRKTVTTTYWLQTNNINTAQKIKAKELGDHDDIKEWPVRIIGSSKLGAWVFLGELMAFDAITLAKVADIATLENLNPLLKGRFPKESKYYEFNTYDQAVYFTANDGTKWKLDANTLKITTGVKGDQGNQYEVAVDSIETLRKINRDSQDSLFRQYSQPATDFRNGKLSMEQYQTIQKKQLQKRTELNKYAAALDREYSVLQVKKANDAQIKSAMSSLARINPGYSQMGIAIDTLDQQWVALYDANEFQALPSTLYIRRATDETARRFLRTGSIVYDKNGQPQIEKNTNQDRGSQTYLDGSLLRDKETATTFRLTHNRYLVIHKDKIGSEGKILVSAVEKTGRSIWTSDTGLKTWFDWKLFNNRLIVFGQDNKELMSDECNKLLIINLNNGAVKNYDYFTDRD